MESICIRDFSPLNRWEEKEGQEQDDCWEQSYSIDKTTNRQYWQQGEGTLWVKCALLLPWTALSHIYLIAKRLIHFVSLYHFWHPKNDPYCLTARVKEQTKDLFKIAATPLLILCLEISALYGLINPYDG